MPVQNKRRIFVYGTLKRGYCRAANLVGQQFLGEAKTLAHYRLFDCGSYPGLVEAENGLEILGEVWTVDAACLRQLDLVEAVEEGLYRRGPIKLQPPFDSLVESYCFGDGSKTLAFRRNLFTYKIQYSVSLCLDHEVSKKIACR